MRSEHLGENSNEQRDKENPCQLEKEEKFSGKKSYCQMTR